MSGGAWRARRRVGAFPVLPTAMAPPPRLNAVAFVSPQNHPILIRTFAQPRQDELKYHYIAHTSLDVIEERSARLPRSPAQLPRPAD